MNKRLSIWHCVFGMSLWLTVSLIATDAFAAVSHTLTNGLQVIVQEDHRAPIIVSQIWYKVGSVDEPKGITGVSHALEHMMFKGTKLYGPAVLSRVIAVHGGHENATTSKDYTFYYQMIAASELPLIFKLEADRMQNLTLDAAEFAKEIKVVKEERLMRTDSNPYGKTLERFWAASYLNTPYHQPTVGWPDDLMQMQVADVRGWYQQWYVPNNAVLIVVGDVVPQQVFAQAQKSFGDIPMKQLPIRKLNQEVVPLGLRQLAVKAPATVPWLVLGFNVPSLKSAVTAEEAYALMVIAGILDSGSNGRFAKELVRKQGIVIDANTDYDLYARYATTFTITATPAPKKEIPAVKAALLQQVAKLKQQLISETELNRVKNLIKSGEIFSQDSITTQATRLGLLSNLGYPPEQVSLTLQALMQVTPQQIRAVAIKYLTHDKMTVAILEPLSTNNTKTNTNTAVSNAIS